MNPFDLPVHPAVVHFPIALLVVAWAAQLGAYAFASETWSERSTFLETVGVASLPVVLLAGFIDTRGIGFVTEPQWDQPLIWHFLASIAAVATWSAHWLWSRRRSTSAAAAADRSVLGDLGAMTLGVWLLVLTGAIAGEMVYAP